ncbi:MAG: hypothetical protein D3910_29375 [Candidatus Electrothrix sp. ATG2]|nr:hypothetical protein [Candidatus Electrothrix sp. ATG2]
MISQFHEELRSFVDNLNIYSIDFIERYIDTPLNKWFQLEQMPWLKDKCVVGIMGRYATGKTTLMNTLLELNLPTDSEANTAIPAYIAHGSTTESEYRILDINDEIKKIPEEMSKIFDHVYSDNFPFSKIVQYLVLNQNSRLLEEISFLDTPGISNNQRDMDITANVINQCDVVFWLFRATDGDLDHDFEIPFIKNNKIDKVSNMYVILTFTDQCFNIKNVKSRIEKTLQNKKINCKGIIEFTTDKIDVENCKEKIIIVLKKEEKRTESFQPINFLKNDGILSKYQGKRNIFRLNRKQSAETEIR